MLSITSRAIIFVVVMGLLLSGGCDFAESQLVKEQAITFEQEIAYRQRKELELEEKIRKANERIEKLESQLACKEVKDAEKKEEKKKD